MFNKTKFSFELLKLLNKKDFCIMIMGACSYMFSSSPERLTLAVWSESSISLVAHLFSQNTMIKPNSKIS